MGRPHYPLRYTSTPSVFLFNSNYFQYIWWSEYNSLFPTSANVEVKTEVNIKIITKISAVNIANINQGVRRVC